MSDIGVLPQREDVLKFLNKDGGDEDDAGDGGDLAAENKKLRAENKKLKAASAAHANLCFRPFFLPLPEVDFSDRS